MHRLLESFHELPFILTTVTAAQRFRLFFSLCFAVCVYKGHSRQIIDQAGNRKSACLKAEGQVLPPAMCAPGGQGEAVPALTCKHG